MSLHYLVVPTRQIFADCQTDYHLILRKTIFDHTALIQLCLAEWETLNDPTVSAEELQALTEQLVFVNYRKVNKRKTIPTQTEMQCLGYALRQALKACHESFKVWVDIAQAEYGFLELKHIRPKGYVSPTGLIVELYT